MKKFGFDIDGTVTCPTSFIPFLNKSFGTNITLDDLTEYALHPFLNITEEQFWKWMDENEPTVCRYSPIAKYFHVVFPEWMNDHEFIFISARRKHLLDVTEEWLHKHKIPFSHVELIGGHNKVQAIKDLDCDIFFEDKHDNACDIAVECKIPVILFDTPYNREATPEGVIRVNDWKEAKAWVDNWLKKN
jgi:uncharacterized protein